MVATQAGIVKVRTLISTANEVCNLVRQKQGQSSKFLSNVLHVTDVVGCLPKLYLDRGYDPAGVCYQLIKMFQGKMLENASMKRFCDLGYEHEPVYGGLTRSVGLPFPVYPRGWPKGVPRAKGVKIGEIKEQMREKVQARAGVAFDVEEKPIPTLAVHATPDFVAPASIVGGVQRPPQIMLEMATIGYALPVAHYMAMQQARFLSDLGKDYFIPLPALPDPDKVGSYLDDPVNFPQYLFFNHLLQLAAYHAAVSQEKIPLTTKFLAIYTNAEREYTFLEKHLDVYNAYFEARITPTAFAVTRGAVQVSVQPGSGVVERGVVRQGFDEDAFKALYFYELHTPGILLASIQCPTCPYYSMSICPGIPPARAPMAEYGDCDRLSHFLQIKKWVDSPLLTQAEIDAIQTKTASTTPTRRQTYLTWLQGVLGAVPLAPIFPLSGVDWTGLVSSGTCDWNVLIGQMPAFSPAGHSERATPPNP
jgi:hypothetical protein